MTTALPIGIRQGADYFGRAAHLGSRKVALSPDADDAATLLRRLFLGFRVSFAMRLWDGNTLQLAGQR